MKTLIKYITLLLVGGVIIPLYSNSSCVKTALPIAYANTSVSESPVDDTAFRFSFINDVAAKILPVINFFK
jgi:hypothetical protein